RRMRGRGGVLEPIAPDAPEVLVAERAAVRLVEEPDGSVGVVPRPVVHLLLRGAAFLEVPPGESRIIGRVVDLDAFVPLLDDLVQHDVSAVEAIRGVSVLEPAPVAHGALAGEVSPAVGACPGP